jgi:hypothetical protein
MTKNLKPSGPVVHIFPLALCAAALVFLALHRGTYSVVERQQAALVVWLAIGLLAAFGFFPRTKLSLRDWIPAIALLLVGIWMAIGLFWTESRELTFNEVARDGGYLGLLVLFLLGAHRRNWRLIAAGLLLAAVTVCALAFASRLAPSWFPEDSVARTLNTTRLNYPLGYWNAVGCWAAITLVLCVAWSAHARSAIVRGLALAAVPLCIAVIYLTFSRAALGGLGLGLVVVVAFSRFRTLTAVQAAVGLAGGFLLVLVLRNQPELVKATGSAGAGDALVMSALAGGACFAFAVSAQHAGIGPRLVMAPDRARSAFIGGAILCAIAFVVLLAAYGGRAQDQFNTTTFAPNDSADARFVKLNGNRIHLWRSAQRAFESQPSHGIGAGTFGFWWNRNGVNDDKVRDVHNIYIEALAEGGVPGLLLLLGFLAALGFAAIAGRAGLKSDSDVGAHAGLLGVFGVFIFQAGLDWIWESTAVTVAVLIAISTAAAASRPVRESAARLGTRFALIGVAALALMIQLPGLAAASRVTQSREQFKRHDYAAAVGSADDAITAEPWAASGYGQRALALEAARQLRAAELDLKRAERREPTNWVWPLLDTRIQVKLGNADAAKRELLRAKALHPYSELFNSSPRVTRQRPPQ